WHAAGRCAAALARSAHPLRKRGGLSVVDSLQQGAPALDESGVPSALPQSVRGAAAPGTLSQWQLIGLRFSKHRLAVAALFALFVLYALAVLSEPLAPYA